MPAGAFFYLRQLIPEQHNKGQEKTINRRKLWPLYLFTGPLLVVRLL